MDASQELIDDLHEDGLLADSLICQQALADLLSRLFGASDNPPESVEEDMLSAAA